MGILFFTNTPSEYRIPLYTELSRNYPIAFVFTKMELAEKVYNTKIEDSKLNGIRHIPFKGGVLGLIQISKMIDSPKVDGVVIPPMDSIIETIYSYCVFVCAKRKHKRVYAHWIKWVAPKDEQPFSRKVKNIFQRMITAPINRRCDYYFGSGKKSCEYFVNNGGDKSKCGGVFYSSMSPVCDLTNWKREMGVPENKIIVLYFGRVIEKKGLRYLIDAMSLVGDENKGKIWLVVAGDGEDKQNLERYAKEKKVHNITWLGYVHPDRRYDYFSQCDIFVLPTYYYQGSVEGWGLTVNEAIQCGKRVIATEAVGSAYDLVNSKNGRIVKAKSGKAIANAIEQLMPQECEISAKIEDDRLLTLYNYKNSANEFIRHFKRFV